jgi:hypothetical protein
VAPPIAAVLQGLLKRKAGLPKFAIQAFPSRSWENSVGRDNVNSKTEHGAEGGKNSNKIFAKIMVPHKI